MNVDTILCVMNGRDVAYLLIGGMNFLLRHAPILTYDVDLWIEDTPENLRRCEEALGDLEAEWGQSDGDWGRVDAKKAGWLARQNVFCLTSPHGAIDIFRSVPGLPSWVASSARASPGKTAGGTPYLGLSDEDMLQCQLALPEGTRRQDRVDALRRVLERGEPDERRRG